MFVRQDLPLSQQVVQANHATFSLATLLKLPHSVPNIIVIGVPNQAALNRVVAKLQAAHIAHYCWHEPDYDFGFTAIATAPLSAEHRQVLAHYRLWRPNDAGADQSACGVMPDRVTIRPVAQVVERRLNS